MESLGQGLEGGDGAAEVDEEELEVNDNILCGPVYGTVRM